MTLPVTKVLIVGHGAMGSGIALSFARGGFETTVLSRSAAKSSDPANGVRITDQLPAEQPDLVIEAVPEQMALKTVLFERLERTYGPTMILASNTSSLPLQEMADRLRRPAQFIGIHYMHPAEALPMVEVVRASQTSDETVTRTVAALARTGKEAILLNRPVVGFLINRLQHAILHEAYHLIEEGIVRAEDVDNVAKWLLGPRMCVTGLIEQKDISGLDTHALAQRGIVPHLHHGAEPSRLLQEKYQSGQLGVKTGVGFYDWRNRDVAAHKKKAGTTLERLLRLLRAERA